MSVVRGKSFGMQQNVEKISANIQPSSASSLELLTKMAVQYSAYCQTDLSAQVSIYLFEEYNWS